MPVYDLLSQPYTLRGWKKLSYALQNYVSGHAEFYRKGDFFLLQCCDGRTAGSLSGIPLLSRPLQEY